MDEEDSTKLLLDSSLELRMTLEEDAVSYELEELSSWKLEELIGSMELLDGFSIGVEDDDAAELWTTLDEDAAELLEAGQSFDSAWTSKSPLTSLKSVSQPLKHRSPNGSGVAGALADNPS